MTLEHNSVFDEYKQCRPKTQNRNFSEKNYSAIDLHSVHSYISMIPMVDTNTGHQIGPYLWVVYRIAIVLRIIQQNDKTNIPSM